MLAVGGGFGIIYLGADLPAEESVGATRKTAPQAVVLGFIGANGSLVEEIRKTHALLIEDFELLERHLVRLGARF